MITIAIISFLLGVLSPMIFLGFLKLINKKLVNKSELEVLVKKMQKRDIPVKLNEVEDGVVMTISACNDMSYDDVDILFDNKDYLTQGLKFTKIIKHEIVEEAA